mmetsp:Transcript_17644/g.35147  ORF Transcript_17644/g.35147 Transcript_17644/m.35147 type:complete len:284 (-) Transcript_17644:180-1031(-)
MRNASSPLQVCEPASILNRSSSNLGSWEVPCSAPRPTTSGTLTSVYPCSTVCRSRKNCVRARSSRATGPDRAANRAPLMPTARCTSHPPRADATSSCHRGSKPSDHPMAAAASAGLPQAVMSSFSVSSPPSGTRSSNRFGTAASAPSISPWITASSSSAASASDPAAADLAFARSASSTFCSRISIPTSALAVLRMFSAASRLLISSTRLELSCATVPASSIVASFARRERRCERITSRLFSMERASGDVRDPRDRRAAAVGGNEVSAEEDMRSKAGRTRRVV